MTWQCAAYNARLGVVEEPACSKNLRPQASLIWVFVWDTFEDPEANL